MHNTVPVKKMKKSGFAAMSVGYVACMWYYGGTKDFVTLGGHVSHFS